MEIELRILYFFKHLYKDFNNRLKPKEKNEEQTVVKDRCAVEITTNMGCANNCIYCPQEILLKTYFKEDKNRKSTLNFDDFKLILKHMPKNWMVNFGGMSEPFANPLTVDFIKEANRQKRLIRVNTTLRHVSLKDLKKIKNINYKYFCVHTPDKDYIQQQKVDEEYLKKIKLVKTFKNVEFVVLGRPHDEILKLLDGKIKCSSIVMRGNNLNLKDMPAEVPIDRKDFKPFSQDKKVVCSRVYYHEPITRITRPEWPVLLPDGTLVLCCIDYGMKHVIGNLYKNTYDEIMNDNPMKEIEASMLCENDKYLLCRDCEWALELK